MKKTYGKPVLTRRERLSAVTAAIPPSVIILTSPG